MLHTEFEGPEEHKATFDQYSLLITKKVCFISSNMFLIS